MLPSDFELHRPTTVEEAAGLRAELGDAAALYAGGTELLLAMKLGVLDYEHLIDVKRIDALRGIERRDGELRIGAARHAPRARDAARAAGAGRARAQRGQRPRALPPARWPATSPSPSRTPTRRRCWSRSARASRWPAPTGRRELALEDFLVGAYETELGEDELIEAVIVPVGGDAPPTASSRCSSARRSAWPRSAPCATASSTARRSSSSAPSTSARSGFPPTSSTAWRVVRGARRAGRRGVARPWTRSTTCPAARSTSGT